MKRSINFKPILLAVLLASYSGLAIAEITVDKSQGQLTITSDIEGLVIVKIIGPDDAVVVDDQYQGNSFIWSPSSGPDGAYRYDVRVIDNSKEESEDNNANTSDYAGGSIEVVNGAITVDSEVQQ